MRKYCYIWLVSLIYSSLSFAFPQQIGEICHAQNDATYNYPGLWEVNIFGQPICNYWQFLSDDEEFVLEVKSDEDTFIIIEE